MLTVDEFESAFRAAHKEPFRLKPPQVRRVLIVTDLGGDGTGSPYRGGADGLQRYVDATRSLLGVLGDVEWAELGDQDYSDVASLLSAVEEVGADLVCAYRNLKDGSWHYPYSLGAFFNVLCRETPQPVLALPNPHEHPELSWRTRGTGHVMVVADHLAGDDALVNWGVKLTQPEGILCLSHLEDDVVFERYMDVISKVPNIDTETARAAILRQLLKEPRDYIASTRRVLEDGGLPMAVEEVVQPGHRVADYRRIVDEKEVDLLAFHTSDQDQVAMHGAAYSLAIELRSLPLLLL